MTRRRQTPLARIATDLLAEMRHPMKYHSALIERRMTRQESRARYLGLGYWLRRIDRAHRMHVVCRCEVWCVELGGYRFATWRDVLIEAGPGTAAEDIVLEYPRESGRLWRLMHNGERSFPYRDDEESRNERRRPDFYYHEIDPRQRRARDAVVVVPSTGRGVSVHA